MTKFAPRDLLVGRDAELARLRTLVAELAAGRGAAVLIEGEPGIGKSELLRATAAAAAAAGCPVLWGAGHQLSTAFPLVPLFEAFGLQPGVDKELDSGAVAAAERLLALADDICATVPTLLVVDDMHWADETTISVWHRLAATLQQRALLLVGAMRPLPRRADLKALRHAIGAPAILGLRPLPSDAVIALVADLAGAPPGTTLRALAADAGGNPLYVTELVAALLRAGQITVSGDTAEAAGERAPGSLSEAIGDRLGFLPEPAQQVVRAAALLGQQFTAADLAAVLDRPIPHLVAAIDDARAAGVLTETGDRGNDRLEFRHPLIRAALYDGIPATVRARWHRDAARALHQAGASVEHVAGQLLPAITHDGRDMLGDWVVGWLVEAIPALLGRALPVAVDLLTAALPRTQPGDPARSQLTGQLAQGLHRLGRNEEALQLVERAIPDTADPERFTALHVVLSRCRSMAGQAAIGIGELETAMTRRDLDARQRNLLRARIAALHMTVGQIDAAEQTAQETISSAEAADDPETFTAALFSLGGSRAWRGDERGAIELYQRALSAIEGYAALTDWQTLLRIELGMQLTVLDDVEQAEAMLRQAQRLADRSGNRMRLETAHAWLAVLFLDTGRWDDTLTEIAVARETEEPYMRCQLDGAAALIALHRGDPTTARRHLARAETDMATLQRSVAGYLWLARALDRERAGELHDAMDILHLPPDQLQTGDVQEAEVFLADAVRLAVAVGDRAAAAEITAYAETLPAQDEVPHRAAVSAHCRGLLDADPDLLLTAADHYAAARRPLAQAQALEAAVLLLADRGQPKTARTHGNTAAKLYADLDATWDTSRLRAGMRARGVPLGTRAASRKAASGWAALTPAETAVLDLLAEGRSNPQIAAEMMLSRRTVETHVSSILRKLGLQSRTDIRIAAAERTKT